MIEMMTAAALIAATLAPQAAAPAQDNTAPQVTISDRAVNPSEPDFTLVGLPTTLRIPRFGSSFRVTHRFMRPLAQGSFSSLASDFFGIDGGAQVGLEYRFGIMAGTQLGIHRTSDRTIQFFLQQQVVRQGERVPVTVDVIATTEGLRNFRDDRSPAIGAVISRALGRRGAVYAHPVWVGNTNSQQGPGDDSTFVVGLGTRLRVRPTLYLVAEAAPRLGYDPGVAHMGVGVERRAGGHSFQLSVSNGFGTTLAQLARGGGTNDNWFIGFNISRKFF